MYFFGKRNRCLFLLKAFPCFFFCYFFSVNVLVAQTGLDINFDRISSENYIVAKGLSQNSAYCITQDSRGYIWIGTWDGLNRYDGYQFLTLGPRLPTNPANLAIRPYIRC